jgi:nicotinamide phosphoribosyltransferase
MNRNLLLQSDSYKYSHFLQYPEGAQHVVSYIEARGYSNNSLIPKDEDIVFCGIEGFIKDFLLKPFEFYDVADAAKIVKASGLPFNEEEFIEMFDRHNGYFPIHIESLPEGTVTQTGIPLVQIWNMDLDYPWLTSWIETMLLQAIWYPTTVATLSRSIKKIIKKYLEETADNLDGLPFKLHDFGQRGVSSVESAAIGGAAHLINFMGTDTMAAVERIYNHYGLIAGFSIPASEHSTITSWGRENEVKAFSNMIDKFGTGLFACVSDSYDIYKACSDLWGTQLKERIETMGGTLVIRPDSGDPVEVTLKVIEILGDKFGFELNTKGYKVLPKYLRIIQGDGVNPTSINEILLNFKNHGWSADNIAFGMGGALLQKVDRDTLKFAMKANSIIINGESFPVYKDPITDPGKRSKIGMQRVIINDDGKYESVDIVSNLDKRNQLIIKYSNGQEYNRSTFEQIRDRAKL